MTASTFLRADGTFATIALGDLPTPANQSANKVNAGPASGSAAAPTYRSLVVADIPLVSGWFNVKDNYGAVGNGSTDDTTSIQNAINAAQAAGGGIVFFPAGEYKITTALSITSSITLMGCGSGGSGGVQAVIIAAVGINGINIVLPSLAGVELKDLAIVYATPATANTTAITLNCATASFTQHCLFDNLYIGNADTCLGINASVYFTVRSCLFDRYGTNGGNGLIVQNSTLADAGDYTIDGNTFAPTAGIAIILNTSGGARIINNKMFAPAGGILLLLPSGAVSSLVMITGNSIEGIGAPNNNAAAIQFDRAGATGSISNVVINGNEFQGQTTSNTSRCVYVPTDPNGIWITNMCISNNIDNTGSAGAHIGYDIDSTSLFSIIGNVGYLHGNPAVLYMVATRAGADLGVVGPNIHTTGINASVFGSSNTTTISPT